jgi:Cft2 family RNA processing exonuclease
MGQHHFTTKLGELCADLRLNLTVYQVSNIATEQMLYTEQDLETSMEKIETINFHEEKEVNGIKFW